MGDDHTSLLTGTTLLDSQIVLEARKYNLALVLAEGEKSNWYTPSNGEKKVLACIQDANLTYLFLNFNKWFIYGFSMGGSGSLTITIRHPNLFAGLFVGAGVMNFTEENTFFRYSLAWDSEYNIINAIPQTHISAFSEKAIFLACGTKDALLENTDNFSRLLDQENIQHYYYQEELGHEYQLLYNSMDLTFNLFSNKINNTLTDFFEGYTPPLAKDNTTNMSILPFLIALVFIVKFSIMRKKE